MYLADTLSRAPLHDISACEFLHELEEIDHKEFLLVSSKLWQQMKHAAADDLVLQELPTGSPRRSGCVHKKPVWHKDYSME